MQRLRIYAGRFMKKFASTFGRFLWEQIIIGFIIATLILWQQIRLGVIAASAVWINWTSFWQPWAWVVTAFLAWHLAQTAYLLHVEDQEQIDQLRANLEHSREKENEAVRELEKVKAELKESKGTEVQSVAAPIETLVTESDPRIYLEFDPDWGSKEGHLGLSTPILLSNRGGSDAHDVGVAKICLRATEITFGHPIAVIAKDQTVKALPDVEALRPEIFGRNLIWPLNQEWESYQSPAKETVEIPMRVAYKSFGGKQIETRCVLVFNGVISALNTPGKVRHNPVTFQGYEFRINGSQSSTNRD